MSVAHTSLSLARSMSLAPNLDTVVGPVHDVDTGSGIGCDAVRILELAVADPLGADGAEVLRSGRQPLERVDPEGLPGRVGDVQPVAAVDGGAARQPELAGRHAPADR